MKWCKEIRALLMKMEAFVLAASLLSLTGCGRTPFPVLEAQLDAVKGQAAPGVISKLGAPNEATIISGEKAYIWSSKDESMLMGDAIGFHCRMRVFVDKADKITHYDFDGNVGGCARYAQRLDENYNLLHSTTPNAPPKAAPTPAGGRPLY
jgi:hypothetical protein